MLKDHYHLKGMKILIFSIETGGKYARDTFHDVENMIFYTGLMTMIRSCSGMEI